MSIVGFNFDSFVAEKKQPLKGELKINNSISIKNVEEKELALGDTKKSGLKLDFDFTINYDPNIGNIILKGNVLYLESSKKIKEILSNWKKDKKLTEEISLPIINTILLRCSIKALTLAQELNLPPHIRINLPTKLKPDKDVSKYIG